MLLYPQFYVLSQFGDDVSLLVKIIFILMVVVEITINILLSLATGEKPIIKYFTPLSSTIEKNLHFYVCYFSTFITVILNITMFISYINAFDFVTNFWYNYIQTVSFLGRITVICIAEHYNKAVKDLCKALKDKLGDARTNRSDAEKSRHIQDFIYGFTKTDKALNKTTTHLRIKVKKC